MLERMAKNDNDKYLKSLERVRPSIEKKAQQKTWRTKKKSLVYFVSHQRKWILLSKPSAFYVERMKEGQDKIYYLTADSYAAAKNSPHLEQFKGKASVVLMYGSYR
ncbi:hypothetical protein O9993_13275 [Vibrio lentus]|nr:hypothetical protein [Vibrio lentus]